MYSFEQFTDVLRDHYGIRHIEYLGYNYETAYEPKTEELWGHDDDGLVIKKIFTKCRDDYWYYLKKIFAPHADNRNGCTSFKLNIVNYTISKLLDAGVNNIIEINPDGVGAGTAIDAWLVYNHVFGNLGYANTHSNISPISERFYNNLYLNLNIESEHRAKLQEALQRVHIRGLASGEINKNALPVRRIMYVDDMCEPNFEAPSKDPNYFKIYSCYIPRNYNETVLSANSPDESVYDRRQLQCDYLSKVNDMGIPVSIADLNLDNRTLCDKFKGKYAIVSFNLDMLTDAEIELYRKEYGSNHHVGINNAGLCFESISDGIAKYEESLKRRDCYE